MGEANRAGRVQRDEGLEESDGARELEDMYGHLCRAYGHGHYTTDPVWSICWRRARANILRRGLD